MPWHSLPFSQPTPQAVHSSPQGSPPAAGPSPDVPTAQVWEKKAWTDCASTAMSARPSMTGICNMNHKTSDGLQRKNCYAWGGPTLLDLCLHECSVCHCQKGRAPYVSCTTLGCTLRILQGKKKGRPFFQVFLQTDTESPCWSGGFEIRREAVDDVRTCMSLTTPV